MGKTLGRILTVAAAVAVNFIPGVGQALSAAIGSTLATAVVSAVTLAGIQSLGGLLGLGPSAPKPDTTLTAIKSPRPPRVSAYGIVRLYGAYIVYETATDGTAVDVYAIHDGQMTELLKFYLADDPVTLTGNVVNAGADGRYRDGKVSLYYTDGSSPGIVISALTAKIPSIWTSSHRGDGVVLLAALFGPIKSKLFLECYPNGVPQASMVAKWQKCPDPYDEDPTDESGWTWTENSIRQLMHYMLVREGVDYATKIAPTIEYWQAASDVCDAARSLKAGGSEARYRSWVSHKHTDSHASVKAAILETCDGWIATRSDGAYIVYAGEYYAPTVTIGPDQIVAYEWSGVGVDDNAAVNEIICSYISAPHDYNTVETDAWRDEDDISERGAILSESFEPQVPSWGQSRALAKRQMARKNAPYRGSVTTNIAGRIARGERYITLNLVDAGTTFYSGPVEIVAVTRNLTTGGITFEWVSADANIDAWNPATEEGDAAALGDRIAPAPVATPTIDTATALLSSDGSSAQIEVVVDAEDRSDLTWYLRWKVTADAVWNEAEYSDIDPGTSITLLSSVVPINASIDVAVAYELGDGRVSPWSDTETVSTSTADLAPSPNTGFTAAGGSGNVTGGWSNSTASNFGHSELWAGPDTDFGNASQIGSDFTGAAGTGETFDESLSAGTYYVWSMAVNASNTAYSLVGPISATVT